MTVRRLTEQHFDTKIQQKKSKPPKWYVVMSNIQKGEKLC